MIHLTPKFAVLVTRQKRPRFFKYHRSEFLRFWDCGPIRVLQFRY